MQARAAGFVERSYGRAVGDVVAAGAPIVDEQGFALGWAGLVDPLLEAGVLGETYNVGGWNEKPNLDIVHTVCALLDELKPRADGKPYQEQITFVTDRPGHDRRYAIDARKIEQQLGWKPAETFETGIRKTVQWYLDNPQWVDNVLSGGYRVAAPRDKVAA